MIFYAAGPNSAGLDSLSGVFVTSVFLNLCIGFICLSGMVGLAIWIPVVFSKSLFAAKSLPFLVIAFGVALVIFSLTMGLIEPFVDVSEKEGNNSVG